MTTTIGLENEQQNYSDHSIGLHSLFNRPPVSFSGICDPDAGFDGEPESNPFWLDMDAEKPDHESLFDFKELDFAQETALSFISRGIEGKRRSNSRSAKEAVRLMDFDEGPEKDIFLYIFGYFSKILEAKQEDDRMCQKGIDFIFGTVPVEPGLPLFEDALDALYQNEARPNLLRLRLIYELWFIGWKMPSLPDHAVPVPRFLYNMLRNRYRNNSERIFKEGMWDLDTAFALMEELWANPGISPAPLYNHVSAYLEITPERFEKVMGFLIDERFVSMANRRKKNLLRYNYDEKDYENLSAPRLYLTGENPIEMVESVRKETGRIIQLSFFDCFKYVVS